MISPRGGCGERADGALHTIARPIALLGYPPSFKLRHATKDMRLVIEAAEAAGLDLKEARAAYAWLDEAVRHGAAGLDYSALVATILSTAEPTASRA